MYTNKYILFLLYFVEIFSLFYSCHSAVYSTSTVLVSLLSPDSSNNKKPVCMLERKELRKLERKLTRFRINRESNPFKTTEHITEQRRKDRLYALLTTVLNISVAAIAMRGMTLSS